MYKEIKFPHNLSSMELIYVKSKVFLHPTKSNKDNVAGFLAICKAPSPSTAKDAVINFVPESVILDKDLSIYQDIDMDIGDKPKRKNRHVTAPSNDRGSFSIPLALLYLIQVRKPSLGWWHGSLIFHTRTGEQMPVLFFHDDLSPLTIATQKQKNKSFDPFAPDGLVYWGGSEFVEQLKKLTPVEPSTIEPSVLLVDPLALDLANFAPFQKDSRVATASTNSQPGVLDGFKLPDVNKFLATAKWRVLETVASFGQKTKSQVADYVDEHVPSVVVKLIMNKPEVQKISNDFDSARVYLAKWAAQVKEEAETSQRQFMLDDAVYTRINKELGGSDHEILTPEEIASASRRKPVSLVEWNGFFDHNGTLSVTVSEVKSRIFHGGLDPDVRKFAWLFLLGVYPWDSSEADRETLRESLVSGYADYKRRWIQDDQKRATDFWKDQKVRIEKDVHRNDRHLAIFKNPTEGHMTSEQQHEREQQQEEQEEDEEEEDSQWNLAVITNRHLFAMREILLTFNEYNENLGYVQGMTDLLSPIYVILENETLAFWAFTKFMDRMERNFVRDQSGMKRQMEVLNGLLQFMLPDLFKHLEKCESTDLFFFFRMLLVWFKREFDWEQVLELWDVLFTDYYSSQFHLFVALAILSDNQRIIIQNLRRFDEVLKYMNDLSGKMNLYDLLIRAELLFLRFKRMMDLIDHENSERNRRGELYEAHINPDLRGLLNRDVVIQKEVERPEGVGGG